MGVCALGISLQQSYASRIEGQRIPRSKGTRQWWGTKLHTHCFADSTAPLCRGSQGDRSKANSAPRPGREGYTTALLLEAGNVLLRKCYDVYPCTRLALQASQPGMC